MQYPNHLILDSSKSCTKSKTSQFWPQLYFKKVETKELIFSEYSKTPFNKKNLVKENLKFKNNFNLNKLGITKSIFFWNNFNFNFIRKERLYTKLKYSRCPQYDIVSGGWAALFAGLIGFLISEKFGIELVDSGDFYNALMYIIFLTFSLRPLIKILGKDFSVSDVFILKFFLEYLTIVLSLVLNFLQKFFHKIK